MSDETDYKMIEILRILNKKNDIMGAKAISYELNKKGYNIGERAVRYHMRILDEKGFTEKLGYSGRKITKTGKKELEKGLVYDQVEFIFSKVEENIYNTTLDKETQKGNIILTSSTYQEDEQTNKIIKECIQKGLAVSPYIKKEPRINPETGEEEILIKTICGTTIDGMILNEGIPSMPIYGGIINIEDYQPINFHEIISYKKTSIPPLDAFKGSLKTSVMDLLQTGTGKIPGNFRLLPAAAEDKIHKLLHSLGKMGIHGIVKIGEPGETVLGIPVDQHMIGIAYIGGTAPLSAAQEINPTVTINIDETIEGFETLSPLTHYNKILKDYTPVKVPHVRFLLNKTWNLINNVTFDLETMQGKLISNVSYVYKSDYDEAIETISELNKSKVSKYISPYYFTQKHPDDSSKIGIGTICSLNIDGILINNGVMCVPKHSGLLETSAKKNRFVELISYSGSSLDPHEIYITNNMTSIMEAMDGYGRILASVKAIPLIAREQTSEVLDVLNDSQIGFSILGNPKEFMYNAKVERYNIGIMTPGGLNPIALINEKDIEVEPKSVERLMEFTDMERI